MRQPLPLHPRPRVRAAPTAAMILAWTASFALSACGPIDELDGGDLPGDAGVTDLDGGQGGVDAGPAVDPAVFFLVDPRPHDPSTAFEPATIANYSDPFIVMAEGLPPGETVLLEAYSSEYGSWGRFVVPDDGTLDLSRDAPVEGSWSGADPDGVIWSLSPLGPPGELDLTVSVVITLDNELLAEGALERRYVNAGVVAQSVSDGTIVGTLALPEGEGPFPGVMIFGGSEGGVGYSEFAAYQMAQLGFAAFGVGYFGAAGLPSELREIPLEQLEANLAWFADDPSVDGDRLGVMGGSRGGELALLLGAYLPVVKAVVANVPSGLIWGSVSAPIGPAWSWEGEPLPYMTSAGAQPEITYDAGGQPHASFRNTFEASIEEATEEVLAAATIAAELAEGPILLSAGDDDQLWPSCPLAEITWDRLVASGHAETYGDVFHCYPNAGHSIGRPGWSTLDSVEYWNPSYQAYTVLGGTPQGNAAAQRASDTELRRFLEEALLQ